MIDYNFPTKRDKLAPRPRANWAARDKEDDRGKNEFQADKLIEEGWVTL